MLGQVRHDLVDAGHLVFGIADRCHLPVPDESIAVLVHRIDQADYAVADRADDLLLEGKILDEGGEFGIAREIPRGGRAADEKTARLDYWLALGRDQVCTP